MVTWSSSTRLQSWKYLYTICMSDYHRLSCFAKHFWTKGMTKTLENYHMLKAFIGQYRGPFGDTQCRIAWGLRTYLRTKTSPSRLSKYVATLRWWCSECRKFGTSQQPGVATKEQMVARSASTAFGQCRFFSLASHANHVKKSAHPTTSNMYCTCMTFKKHPRIHGPWTQHWQPCVTFLPAL